jgi:transposase InsO family protein
VFNKLEMIGDILYKTSFHDGEKICQLVLPETFREVALQGIHDDTGHPGKDKTLWLARQRYYWPGMEKDVQTKVNSCSRCILSKTPVRPAAELVPITTTRPMELVCIDFLSLEQSKGGYENILVITDHFTRFAHAIPCKNQTAQTTAKALYENFFLHYSFPEKLHSDQGRNFESKVIRKLCKMLGIQKTRTTPYHPMGNGSAERFNKTLIRMLSTLDEDKKSDWKSHVSPLVQAYNATRNDSTGYTPHYLMFGWHPRLPIDVFFGMDPNCRDGDHHTYVSKLKNRMSSAFATASAEAKRIAEKNKSRYDEHVRFSRIDVGDKVLVRKVGIQGKHKLADKWESEIYTVHSIPDPDIPVFKVKGTKGNFRTLHRNMLLPFNHVPEITSDQDKSDNSEPVPSKKTTVMKKPEFHHESETDTDTSDDESIVSRILLRKSRGSPRNSNESVDSDSNSHISSSLQKTYSNSSEVQSSDPHSVEVSTPSETLTGISTSNTSPRHELAPDQVPRRSTRTKHAPKRYGEWIIH